MKSAEIPPVSKKPSLNPATAAAAEAKARNYLSDNEKSVTWSMETLYFPCSPGDTLYLRVGGENHLCVVQSIDPLKLDTMTMSLTLKELAYGNFELAKALTAQLGSGAGNASRTTTWIGMATSDHEGGVVSVDVGGDTVGEEQAGQVLPTQHIREGDAVIITAVGGDGTGKELIVSGVPYGIDDADYFNREDES